MTTPSLPPKAAPARNPPRASRERVTDNPGTPTAANPKRTTLPVIFAVNTRPRPRKLTASISPVVNVSAIKAMTNESSCAAFEASVSCAPRSRSRAESNDWAFFAVIGMARRCFQNAKQSQPRLHKPDSPKTRRDLFALNALAECFAAGTAHSFASAWASTAVSVKARMRWRYPSRTVQTWAKGTSMGTPVFRVFPSMRPRATTSSRAAMNSSAMK